MKKVNLYEFEMRVKKNLSYPFTENKLRMSEDAFYFLKEHYNSENEWLIKEYFYVLFLSNSANIIGVEKISVGGISSTFVDVRLLFRSVLLVGAVSIVIAHNHPSGSLKASEADIKLTSDIKKGAKLLNIYVLDHLILTENSYLSFADEGMI